MTPAGRLDGCVDGAWAVGKAVRSTVFKDVEADDPRLGVFGFGADGGAAITGVAAAWTTGAATLDEGVAGSGVLICGLDAVAGRACDGATGVVGTIMVCWVAPIRAARAKAIIRNLAILPGLDI